MTVGPASPQLPTDIHVHVQPWDQLRPEVAAAMRRGRRDVATIERCIADPGALVELLDEQGIGRAALINYPAQDVMGFDERVNDFAAAHRDAHPTRLLAVGGVHPRLTQDPEREVRRIIEDLRLDAVKVHPPHQLVHANDYLTGNRALGALYEGCQSHGVPVVIHTGTSVFPRARGKFGDPMDCDDIALDYPKLVLILAHAGRPLWMETAVHLARRHANVHLDLSGIPPHLLLDYLPKLESLAPKCAFGTDWPSPGVRSIRENVDAVRALPISNEARERILWGTAAELFPPRT